MQTFTIQTHRGVYNPIKAEWTVPPRDARALKSKDLAPRASGGGGGCEAPAAGAATYASFCGNCRGGGGIIF